MNDIHDSTLGSWPIQGSRPGPNLHLFQVRHDELLSPRTGRPFHALVLETPEWANVVAVTRDRQIVLVRQFRFGSREFSIEIPGGMVNPGEEPIAGAQRELREETGYTSTRWRSLGCVQPNPAFHDNLCHSFLAEDAEFTHPPQPDPQEDIEVLTLPEAGVVEQVRSGIIQNSLVLVALARVYDLRDPKLGG